MGTSEFLFSLTYPFAHDFLLLHLIFLSFFRSFVISFFLFSPSILSSFLFSFLSFFLSFFLLHDVSIIIYTLQKVMQHDFNQVYFFYPGFLFIKIDMYGKHVYLPNLLGLFYWGACRVSKLGATSNMKGLYAELIRLNGKCALYQVSAFLL